MRMVWQTLSVQQKNGKMKQKNKTKAQQSKEPLKGLKNSSDSGEQETLVKMVARMQEQMMSGMIEIRNMQNSMMNEMIKMRNKISSLDDNMDRIFGATYEMYITPTIRKIFKVNNIDAPLVLVKNDYKISFDNAGTILGANWDEIVGQQTNELSRTPDSIEYNMVCHCNDGVVIVEATMKDLSINNDALKMLKLERQIVFWHHCYPQLPITRIALVTPNILSLTKISDAFNMVKQALCNVEKYMQMKTLMYSTYHITTI